MHPWVSVKQNVAFGAVIVRHVCVVYNSECTLQGNYDISQKGGRDMARDFQYLGLTKTYTDLDDLRSCLKRDMTGDELEWFVSGFQMGSELWPVE